MGYKRERCPECGHLEFASVMDSHPIPYDERIVEAAVWEIRCSKCGCLVGTLEGAWPEKN